MQVQTRLLQNAVRQLYEGQRFSTACPADAGSCETLCDKCIKDSASRLAVLLDTGSCETLGEMEMYEQFKQSAQALELLHERKMWNEQKPHCLSEASLRFLRMLFHILSEC